MSGGKYFKRGSTSYRILAVTIVFLILGASILSPVFLVEGGNRTLGTVLAIILGIAYLLALLYFVYQWLRTPSRSPEESGKNEP